MKTLLSLIIVVALAGGGYYWYTQNNTSSSASSDSFGMTADESGMDEMDADHSMDTNSATAPTTPATGGTNVNVNASATVSTGAVKEFTVTGKNFSFIPAAMTVKKGDTVRITFVNESGTHDLVVDGYNARTKVIQGGAKETIEFVADKAGSFEYYCSVGKHREMGMKGTLTVQ